MNKEFRGKMKFIVCYTWLAIAIASAILSVHSTLTRGLSKDTYILYFGVVMGVGMFFYRKNQIKREESERG